MQSQKVGSRVPRDRDDTTVPGKIGHAGRVTLPVRKRLDHRGPLSLDISGAWYFLTICAENHAPWVGSRVPRDRAPMTFAEIATAILSVARWYHEHGKWRIALFLVMPDHLHFIVHAPENNGSGHAGRVTLPLVAVIQQFKSYLVRTFGLVCQRDFFDTRLRDDAHYGEKFRYICNNPVRKGLCESARDWPYVIAFDRETGAERAHRMPKDGHAGRVTLPDASAFPFPVVGSRVPRDRLDHFPISTHSLKGHAL